MCRLMLLFLISFAVYIGSVIASPLNKELLEIVTTANTQQRMRRVFVEIIAPYNSGHCASVEVPDDQQIIPDVLNECDNKDTEYKFDNRTGKCYKLHRFGKTWSEAYLTCESEDGHLAIINSEIEAQVLKEIVENHPKEALHAPNKNYFSVGFRDWSENGSVWMTIYGQTLQEAGYDRWANNEPDHAYNNGEHCGSIFRNGRLNDIRCTEITSFICEKLPMVSGEHISN